MLWRTLCIDEDTIVGIWRISETVEELIAMLVNKEWLEQIVSIKSDVKKQEKLAVRVLLKELIGEEKKIEYNSFGKPFLNDKSYYISISHTKGYAAIIVSKKNAVGVDIEQISNKVKRVKSRFISDEEYISPSDQLTHLLLHWSAKETIYKMLDMPGIELKTAVSIAKFLPADEGIFKAQIKPINKSLDIKYFITSDFVITYTVFDN